VDTPGAYPGVAAEQHGQGGAIARSQAAMARLGVPTVACIIGEGGSGGAIALALSDRVLMQENAIYSVITPEGCAAILWRDAGEKQKAAAAFKPDAAHRIDRKSTRLNSSHVKISYAVFCLKKKRPMWRAAYAAWSRV